jgi:preprotein translocase subunit YajC
MNYLSLVVIAVILIGVVAFSSRARRRQAVVQAELVESIEVGSEVMTTSGLYGTVVAKDDDGTVQLVIAPGVEVRWELAALRDVESLRERSTGPSPAADDEEPKQGSEQP